MHGYIEVITIFVNLVLSRVQINIWTTTTWSNVWVVVLPKPSGYEFLIWVLDMNTRFKVFASYNILQCLCDFIHVLIFVTFSKCRKSPKLTNTLMMLASRISWYPPHSRQQASVYTTAQELVVSFVLLICLVAALAACESIDD